MKNNGSEGHDLKTVLVGQSLMFGLLGKILYTYPDQELLDLIMEEDLFSEAPFGNDQEQTQKGLTLVNDWLEEYRGQQEQTLEELRVDYTALFIEITDKEISPWESVYFSEERGIFQKSTLKVREWYRRFGLQVTKLYKEPDDHVGLEFAFISHLASLAVQALEAGDRNKSRKIIKAQKEFLREHIFTWVPTWCEQLGEYARTDFYRGIGYLVQGTLDAAHEVLVDQDLMEVKK